MDHIQRVRNCRESTVEIRMPIDSTDPRSQVSEPETGCESPADAGAGNPNE